MPVEKSELFSFLAAAVGVRESWRGKLQPVTGKGGVFGALQQCCAQQLAPRCHAP